MLRYFVYAVDELKYNSEELLQKSSRLRNELSSGTLNPTMSHRRYFSVQSNQFCAVQDAVCAVQLQDEKLCSPKLTKVD